MKSNNLKNALKSGYRVTEVRIIDHKVKVFLEHGLKVAIFVVSINYADKLNLI